MELISSSLPTPDSDGRFEELVRSCWGLPDEAGISPGIADGDPGDSSGLDNSAVQDENGEACARRPIRVVVTGTNGSVSVSNLCLRYEAPLDDGNIDDTSISEKQAEDIRRQLAARGIHAVHIRLLTSNPPLGKGASGVGASVTPLASQTHATTADLGRGLSVEKLRIARLGPAGDCERMGSNGGGGGYSGLDQGLLR